MNLIDSLIDSLTDGAGRMLHAVLELAARSASAHCDTADGPVVKAGRRALISGDVNHALAWVRAVDEDEVRVAFAAVLDGLGPERTDADRRFLETLVRLHRTGEGAPYTGIKPSGTPQPAAVSAADRALETRSLAPLEGLVQPDAWAGVAQRFSAAVAMQDHGVADLTTARADVAAYVDFVHHAARHSVDRVPGRVPQQHAAVR